MSWAAAPGDMLTSRTVDVPVHVASSFCTSYKKEGGDGFAVSPAAVTIIGVKIAIPRRTIAQATLLQTI
jgi:hypothetical protein